MSEIEKMYENVGIKKVRQTNIAGGDYPIVVGYEAYPPFTAEKQWALIKFLMMRETLTTRYWGNIELYQIIYKTKHYYGKTIEECLAKVINNLWQDLTDNEKQQIKEILND